tara:strand:- start:128 stop:412 length:285 start_codon:yes stop_codon:yes gene_type:complete
MDIIKLIEMAAGQGLQVWLSKLSRQRNFYMSSFLRDLSQLTNHMQDFQAGMSGNNDMNEVLKALTGAKPKADTNVIDYDKLADKVAKRIDLINS